MWFNSKRGIFSLPQIIPNLCFWSAQDGHWAKHTASLRACVHACVRVRRCGEVKERGLQLIWIQPLWEMKLLLFPQQTESERQIIPKNPVIIMKSAKPNGSLWPSQRLCIAINILWPWIALIRCKPHAHTHTQREWALERTQAIFPWRKVPGWSQPVCLSVCANQFSNWRKGCP